MRADAARPGVIVSSDRDISRLILRLFTRWTLPRVEIHMDSLPPTAVQLIQHRITRISQLPAGGLGVTLAALTLVAGTYAAWTSLFSLFWTPTQVWQRVLLIAIAAMYAALLGRVIGSAWIRLKLARELRRLRRMAADKVSAGPAQYAGRVPHAERVAMPPATAGSTRDNDREVADAPWRPPVLTRRRRQKLVVLREVGDLRLLRLHLLSHWRLPRIRIEVEGVAPVDVQHAQHRLTLLSEACNCALGASLAAITILGGVFIVEWDAAHNWDWMVPDSWGPLAIVPVAALAAAGAGVAAETTWNRMKMLRIARGAGYRLGAA